ncbi:MAG TPA: HNH endonuclease, partial [Sporichthya sp.]|nr:HNH endonuclease [Sporichthya sp.]
MELGSLTGAECVEHLRAVQRAHNRSSAARLAAVLEVGLCAAGSWDNVARMAEPDKYSRDELRPALGISSAGAAKVMDLAWVVCRRLPEL